MLKTNKRISKLIKKVDKIFEKSQTPNPGIKTRSNIPQYDPEIPQTVRDQSQIQEIRENEQEEFLSKW